MEDTWKDSVHRQRAELARLLHAPLANLAVECAAAWGDRERLNQLLAERHTSIPFCTYLYALDTGGIQLSDNVGCDGPVPGHFGRDRSERPYMQEAIPPWGFLLSDAYVSQRHQRLSLTALHIVRGEEQTRGYIGSDFALFDLPAVSSAHEEPRNWRQIKGDPAIRETLFLQSRIESPMDRNIDRALSILQELMTERGMFQVVIHFSSSRATGWFVDDPFRYRILEHEALADPDICLTYPRQPYPESALIPQQQAMPILLGMRNLRLTDQTIYLRSASINIFNGLVSLTFSCDGSHYMAYEEFLDKEGAFWNCMTVC